MNAKSAKLTRAQIVKIINEKIANGCADVKSTINYFNEQLSGQFTQTLLIDVVHKFNYDEAHGREAKPTEDKRPTERTLDKIKKLLAVANDTRGDINETTAAARQAANMMREYNVTMAEMIESEIKSDNKAIVEEEMIGWCYKNKFPLWVTSTAISVADTFDCKVRTPYNRDVNHQYYGYLYLHIFGYNTDVIVAKWVFSYLLDRQNDLAHKHWEANKANYKARGYSVQAVKSSYLLGISGNIRKVLKAYKDSLNEIVLSSGNSLMVIKEHAITDKFGEFKYNDVSVDYVESARRAGAKDADLISLVSVIEDNQENIRAQLS